MNRSHFSNKLIAWLIFLCICAGYSLYRISTNNAFESNILSLLPKSAGSQQSTEIQQHLQQTFDKTFVVLIQGKRHQEGLVLAKQMAELFAESELLKLDSYLSSPLDNLKEVYLSHRFQLLNTASRKWLTQTSAEVIAQQNYEQLYSLTTNYRAYDVIQDPFNLGGKWLSELMSSGPAIKPTEIPSISEGQNRWYILKGTITGSPFDLNIQQAITQAITNFDQQHISASYQMLKSGLIFHAAEGARVAKSEVSTVGIGSLLGICLLVWVVFASWRSTAAILFTLASSSLVALAVSLFIYPKVHLVTLAFGSTLLGLAADYCFHFLVKYRSIQNAKKTGYLIRKGLLFGACSSIAAYLVQLFSPFPALQQFAVFLASGLAAACGSVFLLSTFFKDKNTSRFTFFLSIYDQLIAPFYRKLSNNKPLVFSVIALFLISTPIFLFQQGTNDDLRQLNTSGETLIQSEQRIQQLLAVADSQRYFVVAGDTPEQILDNVQNLTNELRHTLPDSFSPILSASGFIPTQQQQYADFQLIKNKLYSQQGALPLFCQKLAIACSTFPQPEAFDELTVDHFSGDISQLWPVLSLLEKQHGVVLIPSNVSLSSAQIQSLSQSAVNITYVDQVTSLSTLLSNFRVQVSVLLVCFGLLLAGASWLVFKGRAISLMLPLVIAVLASLTVAAASNGITLFHVLALLLVIGIAVDTAAFYLQPGLDAGTWLASTLSCLTSLLAFGLLAFSQVPLLHQFGLVVFTGLLCAWLITPLIFFIMDNN